MAPLGSFPAFLAGPCIYADILLGLVAAGALGYLGAPLWLWTGTLLVLLAGFGAPWWVLFLVAAPAVPLLVPAWREQLLTRHVLRLMKSLNVLPQISETERTAIEAGTVWVEGELFSGRPRWGRILKESYPELSDEERTFLDGPAARVCALTDDWRVFQDRDLPEQAWEMLKRERFFGMIIPKEYGGLGFGPAANSAVVQKLASRSLPLGITVMVPNSLGPAELLIHYGTEAQKQYWLPRLARGEEIPCFALTEPAAGSDAGSIQARGEVFRGDDGRLQLRLEWNKRYITLAAISTVLGLAFKLRDPHILLGRGEDLGITCALIPTSMPGVVLGKRHDPLAIPFYNCPTEGHGVVVPLDAVIGGADGVGQGWRMLMECLAAGRGISLPATATGGAKLAARVAGAYAAVRRQFGLPIGRFEGIEEPLARIGGLTWLLEAARRFTVGGLQSGAKPAVATAIAKYNSTEIYRRIINDAMDVCGGAGISRGPRNLLAHGYMGCPISITVEGANILTRTLMVFGQGAIRCHPYTYAEIAAVGRGDLGAFDRALFGHIGHVVRNGCRAFLLSLTRGWLATPWGRGPAARYQGKLSWAAASFALLADLAMGTLAGDLKRKEKLTGRFADVFSWLYLGTAALRRFEAEGRRKDDLPFLRWSLEHALAQIQQAFDGIYANFDVPVLGWLLRGPIGLWSRMNPLSLGPSDRLGGKVARALQVPGPHRDHLTRGIHVASEEGEAMARLDRTLELVHQAEAVVAKIKDAVRGRRLPKGRPESLVAEALAAQVIGPEEAELLQRAEAARWDAIQVDSFGLAEYLGHEDPHDAQALAGR
ncbi:MAG: acyl-CoA dehydrogenase [Planctomycetes bacterium]|nr:acyl-CoA dehydrogenase [Planctomycetota bacterium]